MKKLAFIFVFFIGTITLYAIDKNQTKTQFDDIGSQQVEPSLEKQSTTFRVVLSPLHRTRLSSQISSPVRIISKRMGDSFIRGEVLIQLDDDVYIGNLKKAQASLMKAKTEFEGKRELYHEKAASLFELKEAEANLQSAESDVIVAKKNLDAVLLIAPYNGKVVSISIEEHELPLAGKELIEIVDDSYLLAKLLVPSDFTTRVNLGDTIDIHVKELNKSFKAVVKRISPVIDPSSSTFKVDAEIDNRDGILKAGMTGITSFINPVKSVSSE